MLLQPILRLLLPQDLVLQMVKFKDFIVDSLPDDGEQIFDAGDILMFLLGLHELVKRLMFGTPTFLDVLHELYELNEDIDD